MTLEANPIMRRLGWRFALLTLLICLVPYISTDMGVMVLVPFLLISASNTSRIWFIRTYGELAYRDLLNQLAKKSKLSHAIAGIMVSASFTSLAGFVLLFLAPDPSRDWGFWVALGIIVYAFVIALYGSLYMRRLFKAARTDISPTP